VSYQALEHVRVSAGAVNLLNRYPNKINSTREYYYDQAKFNSAVGQYPSFSPFGFDGGFYYVRASYSF